MAGRLVLREASLLPLLWNRSALIRGRSATNLQVSPTGCPMGVAS
ncbi:hypothetical protein [Nonomuraea recticatena]